MGHSGGRPATAVPHDARNCCLYNVEIQPKNVIIIRKKKSGRRGEGSEEEVVKVRSSVGFSSR
jgi:hypothetical protein